jgi:hypothetical protein
MIVKPGFKTTEFVVSVLAGVGSWLAAWDGTLSPKYAAIASAVAAGLYSLSRALTKYGALTGGKAVVPVVPAQAVAPAPAPVPVQPQQV